MEDIYSTKTAAMNFLHELCKARAKGNLDMLMQARPRCLLTVALLWFSCLPAAC